MLSFRGLSTALAMPSQLSRQLQVVTWNIAAVNNNPFEYWITYDENPAYAELMADVEDFLENPGDKDVPVTQVFSEAMFESLEKRMSAAGWPSVRSYWEDDFSKRKIVSGFVKDAQLGSKRLASMPDRITNTINTEDGKMVFRPTIINMYEDDLSTQDLWWSAWEKFMFEDTVKIKNKAGEVSDTLPYTMLQTIRKAKYPDVTEQEEIDSLPLQTLCGAIFDAILVHMMNSVSKPEVWQPLKKTMIEALNKKKFSRTLDILESTYMDSDVITLQEVSSAFVQQAREGELGRHFHILSPASMDATRDQNSVICLRKSRFPKGMDSEFDNVYSAFDPSTAVAPGDLFALVATDASGSGYLIASFHGDTNGLATKPVLGALMKAKTAASAFSRHRLIFGLDANTYEKFKKGKQQDFMEFVEYYSSHGLSSCWGDAPSPKNYTTYNARTFLQPQLNKACRRSEKREKGDVNPKDFILFAKSDFQVLQTWKDNTGLREYVEDMAFPTLQFPSDHGIVATVLDPQ